MVKNTLVLLFLIILNSTLLSNPSGEKSRRTEKLAPSFEQFTYKQQLLNSISPEVPQGLKRGLSTNGLSTNLNRAPKNKGRAFLKSLLLPGWGQHYAESGKMMKVFIASEVLLWGSFVGLRSWGNWLEDDYRNFSVQHAGVNLEDKPDLYFVDISNFDDIFEYNQAQLRNRDVSAVYSDTESFFWKWDSEQNRRKFDDMRIRSDRARNRADLTLAFIFTNHLISAIHSTLAVFKFNKRLEEQNLGLKLDYNNYSENRFFKIRLVKTF